jgi:pimeloyl-ACP methyl ester carboxylesterase
MQLLADMSFDGLLKRIAISQAAAEAPKPDLSQGDFDWKNMNQRGECVVRLRSGEGQPLVLIHGNSGIISPFQALQRALSGAVYAIQLTPEAPTDSVETLVAFYYQQLVASIPRGPLRMVGYSGGTIIAAALVQEIERKGGVVTELIFLDHTPLIVDSPIWRHDEETVKTGVASAYMYQQLFDLVVGLYVRDDGGNNPANLRRIAELHQAHDSEIAKGFTHTYWLNFKMLVRLSTAFMLSISNNDPSQEVRALAIAAWMKKIKANVSAVVATQGIIGTLPPDAREEWYDLGLRRSHPGARVVMIEAGHFDIFSNPQLINELNRGVH